MRRAALNLFLFAAVAAAAQHATAQSQQPVVVLDPAHGGDDPGAPLLNTLTEKSVTLATANKLRSLLSARGLQVVLTHDQDTPFSLDDRAGIASHPRAVACIVLHATRAGEGVHLYTSTLAPAAEIPYSAPWVSAQAPWSRISAQLATEFATALNRSKIPTTTVQASVRPLDSMQCPAVVLEIGPRDHHPDSLGDPGYQQKVAEAVAGAMLFWPRQYHAPPAAPPSTAPVAPPAASITATPHTAATPALAATGSVGRTGSTGRTGVTGRTGTTGSTGKSDSTAATSTKPATPPPGSYVPKPVPVHLGRPAATGPEKQP